MTDDTEFTDDERDNIIKDIASYKIELEEIGGGGVMTDAEVREYVEELRECDDEMLRDIWFTNVGEWIHSRHDRTPTDEELLERGLSIEEWMDGVFDSVKADEEVPHGYVSPLVNLPA